MAKYCSHCGKEVNENAVICPNCGCQVGQMEQPHIVINNSNSNTNTNVVGGFGRMKNKWVAFLLCFFIGFLGAHKFYEGKVGMGILYLFTGGLFGIGWLIDTLILLFKPNPYFV